MRNENSIDVLIVGAGLSGIDAAYRLRTRCPTKTYVILESRERIGGTWDLFRYPGIRSDSDIETLGFPFRKWTGNKSIADGPSIRDYIEATSREFGIYEKIRFKWRAIEARWSSQDALWTVSCLNPDGRNVAIRCRFLYCCTGYYSYAEGHHPRWPGVETFQGEIIHPQFWPDAYKSANKDIVVIGSGATAITLLPSLAQDAKSVTMLQRSPTYVMARPSTDGLSTLLKRVLPPSVAYSILRFRNILLGIGAYQFARRWPLLAKKLIMNLVSKELPRSIDVNEAFNPRYNPWDQRLCLAPDGDFFQALRSGRAHMETGEIDSFHATGIRLKSGRVLNADTVVSATGLKIELVGGIRIFVDEAEVELSTRFSYKGTFLSEVPNFAIAVGYTNASWTLKCDLAARYVCRLLNFMDAHGYGVACPGRPDPSVKRVNLLDLTSNYVQRSQMKLPRQGDRMPWRLNQNYILDWLVLKFSRIDDGTMKFSRE